MQTSPDVDQHIGEALRSLRNADFLLSRKYAEQQWRANRHGAHIDILDFERAFVRRCAKLGVPMFAHNMVRTHAEQNALYVQGVSKNNSTCSPHVVGCAVDIVHGKRAWELTRAEWSMLGHIGKEVSKAMGLWLTWGGDWKFYDPAHWELANWKAACEARQGEAKAKP